MLVIKNLKNDKVVIASSNKGVIINFLDGTIRSELMLIHVKSNRLSQLCEEGKFYRQKFEVNEEIYNIIEHNYKALDNIKTFKEISALVSNSNDVSKINKEIGDYQIYFVDQENLGII